MTENPKPSPLPTADAATTEPPLAAAEGEERQFPCSQCGAEMTFHVGGQNLQCEFCGLEQSLALGENDEVQEQDLSAMLGRVVELRESRSPDTEDEINEVNCKSCSAVVAFTGTLTSQACPYCGEPLRVEDAHRRTGRIPVDGVVPFRIERNEAYALLAKWAGSRWFAPKEFKRHEGYGRFSGVYLPYWTFDSLTSNRYSGRRGEHYTVTVGSGKNRRRVTKTRWSPASGSFQLAFDDVLVIAGTGLPHKRMVDLEPWQLEGAVPFKEGLLSGFLARTYDVELDAGFDQGKDRMHVAIERAVRQRIGGDVQQIHNIDTRFDAVTYKHVLLPVWMLSYRFKNKPYQVVVNGTTGEVQGDRPYSRIKIALAVIAALAVLALIFVFARD